VIEGEKKTENGRTFIEPPRLIGYDLKDDFEHHLWLMRQQLSQYKTEANQKQKIFNDVAPKASTSEQCGV